MGSQVADFHYLPSTKETRSTKEPMLRAGQHRTLIFRGVGAIGTVLMVVSFCAKFLRAYRNSGSVCSKLRTRA